MLMFRPMKQVTKVDTSGSSTKSIKSIKRYATEPRIDSRKEDEGMREEIEVNEIQLNKIFVSLINGVVLIN